MIVFTIECTWGVSAKGPLEVVLCSSCICVVNRGTGQGRAGLKETGPGDFHKALPCTALLVRIQCFSSLRRSFVVG